ncbi:MAG: hypothetical protein Edafosvirus1_7 [Edafosvirus sp.]|uniref:Uncharacterized protein n=1 Tax=Edafosvirus sp. TaxID=2487765 RepID=A0A3G4ZRX6_9VIRU|nr:MAG: hypothetical protein Edafosvirus1_7 [Edafosvirus sp.]
MATSLDEEKQTTIKPNLIGSFADGHCFRREGENIYLIQYGTPDKKWVDAVLKNLTIDEYIKGPNAPQFSIVKFSKSKNEKNIMTTIGMTLTYNNHKQYKRNKYRKRRKNTHHIRSYRKARTYIKRRDRLDKQNFIFNYEEPFPDNGNNMFCDICNEFCDEHKSFPIYDSDYDTHSMSDFDLL